MKPGTLIILIGMWWFIGNMVWALLTPPRSRRGCDE